MLNTGNGKAWLWLQLIPGSSMVNAFLKSAGIPAVLKFSYFKKMRVIRRDGGECVFFLLPFPARCFLKN